MNLRILGALAVVATLLSACSFSLLPTRDITAGFEPTALGFEIDDSGKVTVAPLTVTFSARHGSIGATIEGYRIEFFDKDDNPKLAGDTTLFASGALNVDVKPGLSCDEGAANDSYRCTVNDTGVRFVTGPSVSVSNFISLDEPILAAIVASNQNGDYAHVVFYGTDDLNRFFETQPQEVALVVPVAGG